MVTEKTTPKQTTAAEHFHALWEAKDGDKKVQNFLRSVKLYPPVADLGANGAGGGGGENDANSNKKAKTAKAEHRPVVGRLAEAVAFSATKATSEWAGQNLKGNVAEATVKSYSDVTQALGKRWPGAKIWVETHTAPLRDFQASTGQAFSGAENYLWNTAKHLLAVDMPLVTLIPDDVPGKVNFLVQRGIGKAAALGIEAIGMTGDAFNGAKKAISQGADKISAFIMRPFRPMVPVPVEA